MASRWAQEEDAAADHPRTKKRRTASPLPPLPAAVEPYPTLRSCEHVSNRYEKLNRIEEGSYGVVYRARDTHTNETVALKRLKLENEKNGFPITSLREIQALLMFAQHPNVVHLREIVYGGQPPSVYLVMEFVEHDLKTLMASMKAPFLQSEIKTLMLQLLSAMHYMHSNWVIHRDLKTSNLLFNNRGEIKVADFGLARKFSSPLHAMTVPVVTCWYRCPELLLGAKEYTPAVDMWSVGCIFGELLINEPILQGQGELDQINKIFQLLGLPNDTAWPGWKQLPLCQSVTFQGPLYDTLRNKFRYITEMGMDLLKRLLCYDPKQRITAQQALEHAYFKEHPLPKDAALFPTWPSKASRDYH